MSAKKRSKLRDQTDAEYQFSDDQPGDENVSEPPPAARLESSKSKFLGKVSRKKVIFWTLLVLIVGMVYQFLSRTGTSESAKQEELAKTAALSKPTTGKVQAVGQKIGTTEIKTVQQAQRSTTTQSNNADLADLQAGLQSVNQSVEDLQGALLTIANSVQALSIQVQALSNAPQVVSVAPPAELRSQGRVGPTTLYHLKAVIPGRAWLESAAGGLVTVKVGDSLKGYGMVNSINPSDGWVGTSSGTVIQYGPNDS